MKNYTDEEIEKYLTVIKIKIENYDTVINSIYKNLIFGKNIIKHFNKKIKQNVFFNIRLLEAYFIENEEYEKLEEINKIKNLITIKPKIKISERLMLMPINLN